MKTHKKKAIICTNDAWTLFHFRGSLMRALMARGFDVIAAGPRDQYADAIEAMGVRFAHIPISPAGMNPVHELWTTIQLYRLYVREKPALVHQYSQKAILYGTIAARLAGVRASVNTVNGLGWTLGEASGMMKVLQPMIRWVMSFALRRPVRLTFQNRELSEFYYQRGLATPEQSTVILGSGIDPDRYSPDHGAKAGPPGRPIRFFLFSRMMWNKGVEEYFRAAEQVKQARQNGTSPEFILIGGANAINDTGVEAVWLSNPMTIPGDWLEREAARGYVDWMPHQEDMLPHIRAADVVVLPSYYPEGVPRSLLEAMGCGSAMITTNTPGCREVVEPGKNGNLVRPRDADDLARAMLDMVDHPDRVRQMGKASRRMVMERFSDDRVIEQTISAYGLAGVPV